MITIYSYANLGYYQSDWLEARYHFSFGEYHNPKRMGFGVLRVINDDIIKPERGFDLHPHKDMEIITYVKQGAITHKDSFHNTGKTVAGDIQVMSAGTGIYHSEFNLEQSETALYQIWILPNNKGCKPRWQSHTFPKNTTASRLQLVVAGDGSAPLHINQDARIYAGKFKAGDQMTHYVHPQGYLLVCSGNIQINEHSLAKGDGAEIVEKNPVSMTAITDAEILLIEINTN